MIERLLQHCDAGRPAVRSRCCLAQQQPRLRAVGVALDDLLRSPSHLMVGVQNREVGMG
jgi:hypothetical protein